MGFFDKIFNKKPNKSAVEVSKDVLDFSEIDSNEKAIELYRNSVVVKIHLMPIDFGGEDNSMNTLYAPLFVKELKERFDTMVGSLLEEGKSLNYNASPSYKGKSFIPSSLTIEVSGDVDFSETISIW